MARFDPRLLIDNIVQGLVDLHPHNIMDILAELDFILEDCGPLFSNYDANIGSFMLHEVNAASGSLLNTMANACAHAVMLTRFCDTLKRDWKDQIFGIFMSTYTGKNVLNKLEKLSTSEQIAELISYGKELRREIEYGETSLEDLHMMQCVAILCFDGHMHLRKFFESFSQNVLSWKYGSGYSILINNGWMPGQGSGADGSGILFPVEFKSYHDNRGLKAPDENYPA